MTFFFTLFVIMFFGFALNRLAKLVRIPALVFYLLFGMLLCFIDSKVSSPSFHILDDGLMGISSYIKKIALIIILLKAGLSLDMRNLRKVGRPAILMSFLPATVEMVAVGLLAPLFFNLSYTESFLLGSVLGGRFSCGSHSDDEQAAGRKIWDERGDTTANHSRKQY